MFYMEDTIESKVTVLFEGNIDIVRDFKLPLPSRREQRSSELLRSE
jgi:hypothetical protein